ncbi:MAG TPA: ATP-binding protein [Methanosarcinaceae archaeon]|nr:ATP-binding protein [Methanosarcinaceae archaeon]
MAISGALPKFRSVNTVNTVKNYIRYLEDTYLVFHLDRFSFKQREQINSPKKIYAIDTGMANALTFRFSENIGNLMENVVAVDILRQISAASSRLVSSQPYNIARYMI